MRNGRRHKPREKNKKRQKKSLLQKHSVEMRGLLGRNGE